MNRDAITALIVEDDPVARQLSLRALAKCGFACSGVSNAAEARELLAQQNFDAIVTDLRMPKEHGYSLVVQLLDLPDRPVIVVMTGVTAPQLASDLLRRGVDDLQYKPVNFELLAHKLSVLVEIRKNAARGGTPENTVFAPINDVAFTEAGASAHENAAAGFAQSTSDRRQFAACACHVEEPTGQSAVIFTSEPMHGCEPGGHVSPYSFAPEKPEQPPYDFGRLESPPSDEPKGAIDEIEASERLDDLPGDDAPTTTTGEDDARLHKDLASTTTPRRLSPNSARTSTGMADKLFSSAATTLASGSHLMWLVIASLTIVSVWLWIQLQVIKQGNQVIAALERVGARIERQQNGDVLVRLERDVPPKELEQLVRIPNLDSLILAHTLVSDDDLKLLCELKKLRSLDLAGTEISDNGLSHLAPLAGLRSLSLEDTKITDKGLEYLMALEKLQRLSLRGTQVTGSGVGKLQESRPDLEIQYAPEALIRAGK